MKDTTAQVAKAGGDVLAASVTVATILEWLPALAALFTIIWTAIRIWETETVQSIVVQIRGRR